VTSPAPVRCDRCDRETEEPLPGAYGVPLCAACALAEAEDMDPEEGNR
jgi:hypothetical protein